MTKMSLAQEIQDEMARVDDLVQKMAVGRYVKILPKPLPRRLGMKRVWKQRFERGEYKDKSREELEQRFGPERCQVYLSSLEYRWGDERCDFYTSRPPFLSEIVELGEHCHCCRVAFDFRQGTRECRNWKGMTIDRVDTGLGPNGDGKLLILDSPDARGFRYHWGDVPGYEANMRALCMSCNLIKSKFIDKANIIWTLLTKYPNDIHKYYVEREFEIRQKETSSNDYRTGVARYVYGFPIPDCTIEGPGTCYECGNIASNRIFTNQEWVRCCSKHDYPQWRAMDDFERVFFGYVRYSLPVDRTIVHKLLESQPGQGQRDILELMRLVARRFLEFLEEEEDPEENEEEDEME